MDKAVQSGARCKTCNATDSQGRPLRGEIDALKAASGSTDEVMDYLATREIKVTRRNVERHFALHSPWARNATLVRAQAKVLEARKHLELKRRDAMEEIQKLIAIGGEMVDNFAEGKDGPQLPVDRTMYLKALELALQNHSIGNVDQMLINVDKAIFIQGLPEKKAVEGDDAESP